MSKAKFKAGDRVLVVSYDMRNNREDRGLGVITKRINWVTSSQLYDVKFDIPLHGFKTHDDYYDSDIRLFDDESYTNCPKCYEPMEKKTTNINVYQCPLCKNIEIFD